MTVIHQTHITINQYIQQPPQETQQKPRSWTVWIHEVLDHVCMTGHVVRVIAELIDFPKFFLREGSLAMHYLNLLDGITEPITKTFSFISLGKKIYNRFFRVDDKPTSGVTMLRQGLRDVKLVVKIVGKIGLIPAELAPGFSIAKSVLTISIAVTKIYLKTKKLIEVVQNRRAIQEKFERVYTKSWTLMQLQSGNNEALERIIQSYANKISEDGVKMQKWAAKGTFFRSLATFAEEERNELLQPVIDTHLRKIERLDVREYNTYIEIRKQIFSISIATLKIALAILAIVATAFALASMATPLGPALLLLSVVIHVVTVVAFHLNKYDSKIPEA